MSWAAVVKSITICFKIFLYSKLNNYAVFRYYGVCLTLLNNYKEKRQKKRVQFEVA